MKHKVLELLILTVVAATALAMSGCGGDAGYLVVPTETDVIVGHWVAAQQSATLTGVRKAAAVGGDISVIFTQAGLKSWSGCLTCSAGTPLSPAFGAWLRTGKSYSMSNGAGQTGSFGWSGTELYSTTRVGAETVYLWWTKD